MPDRRSDMDGPSGDASDRGDESGRPSNTRGTLVAGRYVIDRMLGRGGMATVYLAYDLVASRPVALKILRRELASSVAMERFAREVGVVGRLRHPHIVALHDSGVHDDLPFYVMAFVDGESLQQRVAREGALPVAEVVRFGSQMADALAYAHREGVLHRDITPGNILLAEGNAYLADFGIARMFHETRLVRTTGSGFVVGTPAYMSPEQASGELECDGRSDVYSLGCVLYEVTARTPPFHGHTTQAVIAGRFGAPPPPVRTLRDDVPAALSDAIARAMRSAPDERFQDAAEFGAAILQVGTVATIARDSQIESRETLATPPPAPAPMTDSSTTQRTADYDPSVAPAPEAKPAAWWEDFIDIFYAPAQVFARRARSGFGVPMLVVTVLVAVIAFANSGVMQPIMDAEFSRSTAAQMAKNPQITAEMMERSRGIFDVVAKYGAVVFVPVGIFFTGLVLWLCGKVVDAKEELGQAMMVAAFAFVPRILEGVLNGVQGLLLDPATLDGRFRISLGVGRFLDPATASPALLALVGRLDVFTIWVTVLLAIGLSVTGRIPRSRAAIAAALVWLLGALPTLLPALRG